MQKIGVFCSASSRVPEKYLKEARRIGEAIGRAGRSLVYGGTSMGMMREISQGVKASGGELLGVVPEIFVKNGRIDPDLDHVIRCRDLSDRKAIMVQEAEVFLALPGGVGTLDEVFSTMASCTLGYHGKQVIFYNMDGFWDPVIEFLGRIDREGFMKKEARESFMTASSLEELTVLIEG
mgnify:CR=1 FL=1